MCKRCSFQAGLRSLRLAHRRSTPSLPIHGAGYVETGRNIHTSSRLDTSTFALPVQAQTAQHVLPSLQALSQSYSSFAKWGKTSSSSSSPPLLTPIQVLESFDSTSQADVPKLLYALSMQPSYLLDLPNVTCPTLARLLSLHHYAGARAVLERALEEISRQSTLVKLSRRDQVLLVSTILGIPSGREVQQLKSSLVLKDKSAIQSLLALLLKHMVAYPDRFILQPQIVKTLVSIPEYLNTSSIRDVLRLLERAVLETPRGQKELSQSIPTLHNIMRVYSLQGDVEAVEFWMFAISKAIQAKKRDADNDGISYSTSPEDSTEIVGPNDKSTELRSPYQKPKAGSSLLLGTTYLSSLSKSANFTEAESRSTDSATAMRYFNRLRQAAQTNQGIGIMDPESALDIYAWTAVIQAAAKDIASVSSQALLDVLNNLEKNDFLPSPNIATYTAVMNGLNARGDYARSTRLFNDAVLPLAGRWRASSKGQSFSRNAKGDTPIKTVFILDPQCLAALANSWAGQGQIEKARDVFEWYANRAVGQAGQAAVAGSNNLSDVSDATPAVSPPESGSVEMSTQAYTDVLRGSVAIDTIFVNQVLTLLAKAGRWNSVYHVFQSMQKQYKIVPDTITLNILARTALTVGQYKRRGLVPEHSDDLWTTTPSSEFTPSSRRSTMESPSFFPQFNPFRVKRTTQENESGVWHGQEPVNAVLDMYWDIFKQNYPRAYSKAMESISHGTNSRFFPFSRQSRATVLLDAAASRSEGLSDQTDRWHLTSSLRNFKRENDVQFIWPTIVLDRVSMHMLIALSGYFGRGGDIPLILSMARAMSMKLRRRTVCLAIWSFEETGVYSNELRKLHSWLIDWLGPEGVPSDIEIGQFRSSQWGTRK